MKPNVMQLARMYAELSGRCKDVAVDNEELTKSEAITLRYCGAMSDMIVETLQNLHDKMYPVFSMASTNGILREWGLKELTTADDEMEDDDE